MKILKDPNQVLRIMRAKLDELHKRFVAAGVGESTEISGTVLVYARSIELSGGMDC